MLELNKVLKFNYYYNWCHLINI